MPKTHADGVYRRKDRKGFWIQWRDAYGRRRIRKTDAPTLQQARSALAGEKLRVEQARVLGHNPPGEDTFREVADRYLTYQKARLCPHAYEREDAAFRTHLVPSFPGKLAVIRRMDIQRYVTTRAVMLARPKTQAKRKPGEKPTPERLVSAYTLQRELNMLKHLFRLAVEWEIVPFNPTQGVKSPRVPAGRVRYLQPGELCALVAACPEWLRPVVALAVCTGMRRGEILGLRWLDVDLKGERIVLPQTKNGEGRIVYLNPSAIAALESLPASANQADAIFPPRTPERVSVAFARAVKAVGIADFRFHDLRHTAASWMRMSGADIHTVAQLLGHKDLRMAARYQHLSPAFLGEAVRRLDGVFAGPLAEGTAAPRLLPAPKNDVPRSPGATENQSAVAASA